MTGRPRAEGADAARASAAGRAGAAGPARASRPGVRARVARLPLWLRRAGVFALTAAVALKACDLVLGRLDLYGVSYVGHMRDFVQDCTVEVSVSPDPARFDPRVLPYVIREPLPGCVLEAGVTYRINSLGARDVEREPTPPPGTWRIVLLGDSVTFGWGVERAQRFSDLLEAKLDERARRAGEGVPRVELVNLAVPGYEAVQQRHVFVHRALALDPDVVVYVFNLNDLQLPHALADMSPFDEARRERAGIWAPVVLEGPIARAFTAVLPNLRDLALYRIAHWDPAAEARFRAIHARMTVGLDVAVDLYARSVAEGVARGVLVAVLDLSDWRPLAEACAARGIPYADISYPGALSDPSLMNSAADPHPNERAHAILATNAERSLRLLGLLPGH